MEYNVLHPLQSLRVQGWNFPFYVNQYALGNKLVSDNMYLAGVGDQWSGFFHVMDPPGGKFNNGLLYTGWSITIKEAV